MYQCIHVHHNEDINKMMQVYLGNPTLEEVTSVRP